MDLDDDMKKNDIINYIYFMLGLCTSVAIKAIIDGCLLRKRAYILKGLYRVDISLCCL